MLKATVICTAILLAVGARMVAGEGMVFVSETSGGNIMNELGQLCYHEDSVHDRYYNGTLEVGETFVVEMPVCGPYTQWPENVGNVSISGTAYFDHGNQRPDVQIRLVGPSGQIVNGVTDVMPWVSEDAWEACEGPRHEDDPIWAYKLQNGVWRIEVTNTDDRPIRDLWVKARAKMWQCYPRP